MKTLLYLDDKRNPFLTLPMEIRKHYRIAWVTNYDEFVQYFAEGNKHPSVVSFDHDLAPEHYTPKCFWDSYKKSKKYQEAVKGDYQFETGEDCANWFCFYCSLKQRGKTNYVVHSANPIGADWIREQLGAFKETTYDKLIKKLSK